jgi:hypothetical protein
MTSGVYPVATSVAGDPATTPQSTPISAVAAQRVEWGLTPPPVPSLGPPSNPVPSPAPAAAPPAAARASGYGPPARRPSTGEVDVEMDDGPASRAAASGPSTAAGAVYQALDAALSQPLSVVDLDQYATPSVPQPALPPPSQPAAQPPPGYPPPDHAGDLGVLSPVRVFTDLAVAGETGMLRFEFSGIVKDIFLVRGAPESLNSNQPADRFGEYLVARGFVRPADLQTALAQAPRFGGKLGDALVSMGLMKPLDVFRLLSQQVRERVMELFSWVQGNFIYWRGARNQAEAFPLGLDSFEIIGAGVVTLSFEFLQHRFVTLNDYRPRAVPQPRVSPEAFKLGATPREIWTALDGRRTVREWITRFSNGGDLLTFMRVLYLLLEADLARLE